MRARTFAELLAMRPSERASAEAHPAAPVAGGPRRRRRLRDLIFGSPRNLGDPNTYQHISLVAFLAWVGLGADGLSSSAYGPEETFRAIGEHHYLTVALAVAMVTTILVISVAYSQIIKRFPFGGGGYVVATKLLGSRWGVVSGSALLVDYVLTISVSIASGADQVFSVLPLAWAPWKLMVEAGVIGVLIIMNLRGVKESVTTLTPIFLVFVLTHFFLIVGGIASHALEVPRVVGEVRAGFSHGLGTIGLVGMFALVVRAYSMGAGHLHRHRGRLERAPDHAGAEDPHGAEDDDVHGTVARLHRDRDPAPLHAVPRLARGREDDERLPHRAVRAWLSGTAARWIRVGDPCLRSGAPVRGGTGRVHRWAARHVEHGERLLAAPSLRAAV